VASACGNPQQAVSVLLDSALRCGWLPDACVWGRACVLDSLCALVVAQGHARAQEWVGWLMNVSTHSHMHERVLGAHRHRAGPAHPRAAEVSRLLASDVRNNMRHRAAA